MKKALPFIIAGFAVAPFGLNAIAQQHETHTSSGTPAINSTETTKELRANTTDRTSTYPNIQKSKSNNGYKKDLRANRPNQTRGLKPLTPAQQDEMDNRERTASPPVEDVSNQPEVR